MKKYLKLAALITCIVYMSTVLIGCGGGEKKDTPAPAEQPKKIVLNMGATSTPEHARYKAADVFMEKVQTGTNGLVECKRMFGGVLGNETKMTQAVQAGTLEIGWISDIGMSTVVPEIAFVNLPYLFPTYEDVDKYYYGGWMGDIVKERLEAKGFKWLGWIENDYRWLTNSKRAVLKPEDMKGLKIRSVETPMFVSFFKELGVLPTPMGITEVSTALQQKTVDGQDNGAILTYAYGFAQFQKFLTKTNHSYSGGAIIMNKQLWDSLDANTQKVIADAAAEASKWQIDKNRADVSDYSDKMKEQGMQISEITPELDKKFKEVAAKVWNNKEITGVYGDDVMQRILSDFEVK